ncbi:hypothetical protein BGZ51_006092 [Haplosporangium sp. Z 767]|nr:hypothetical protein BGZ51_006092 [Haplosporangium sp. Z 767]KAF9180792.1 hypothetical protein BGZ50_005904 [Haplosporangium sp. Z 11]
MKPLRKFTFAMMLVSSAFAAMTLQQFMNDPKVQSLAPNLIQEVRSDRVETYTSPQDLLSAMSPLKLPVLDNIVQIISLQIFHAGDADWSRLEAAKLKAIEEHGAHTLATATNLTDIDARRATHIVKTIYDTVINLPAASKETIAARKREVEEMRKKKATQEAENLAQNPSAGAGAEKKTLVEEGKKMKEAASGNNESLLSVSNIWSMLGHGLIKSSNTVRKAKGIVIPSAVCETTDLAYLKGAEDVVYYSSLTHGFADSALVSAPNNATVKSLDLQTIVSSVGRVAVEIQMAQSVARLVKLDPTDHRVRAAICLALASNSATSDWAQSARDIVHLVQKGMGNEIPDAIIHSLGDRASLALVTRGVEQSGAGIMIFGSIPIVRNIVVFSSDVLSFSNSGDVLKFVFCPESSQTAPSKAAVVIEDTKKQVEGAVKKGSEMVQKVFKVLEEAGKKVTEQVKQGADATKENANKAAEKVGKKAKRVKMEASEAGAKFQDKVTEGTEKVNDAGEKITEEIKKDTDKKAEDLRQKVTKEAKKVADKVESVKQEL